jgi:hypothetical protein
MAIKFGMTVAQIIGQLTRGFMKAMGRQPDGLEKIKIQQEAVQRFRDMNKVVDMEGNVLDPSKPIMGGTQEGAALKSGIMRATGEGPREITEDTGKGFIDFVRRTDPEGADKLQKEEDRIRAMIEAANKRAAKNLKDKKKKLDDPEEKAMGGRIGYKLGSLDKARRAFLKKAAGIGGGIAALKTGLLGLSKKAPEAVEKVTENFSTTLSEAPDYFFNLISKIKSFGKKSKIGPQERVDEYSYIGKNGDQYTLTEDIVTGDAQIVKDKMGVGSYGDKTFDTINDRTVMEYKAPKQDVDVESGRGTRESAEYEEYKVEFDSDGTEAGADAIDEIVQKEIIEEATTKKAPSIKKAGGGLAYMLGE